tara:strand:- start:261 stop:2099 length:1839 start_codon:yes stop_codon:yes gene_type:complete
MLRRLLLKERTDPSDREQGSALIVTMVLIMMVSALVLVTAQMNLQKSNVAVESTRYLRLTSLAESGMGAKFEAIAEANSDPTVVLLDIDMAVGTDVVQVRVTEPDPGVYRVRSTATDPRGVGVEMVAMISAAVHPTFRKALYVGNKDSLPIPIRLGPTDNLTSTFTYDETKWRSSGYRLRESDVGIDFNNDGDMNENPKMSWLNGSSYPSWGVGSGNMEKSGSNYRIDLDQDGTYGTYTKTVVNAPEYAAPTGTETFEPHSGSSTWENILSDDGDYVEGEIHVNGNAEIRGNTRVFDTVSATGTVQGDNVPGTTEENVASITPPDLHAQDYASLADTVITPSTINTHGAFYPPVSNITDFYGAELTGNPANQDNGAIHLGSATGSANATFSAAEDGNLIYVKGNLWMHSSSDFNVKLPSSHAVRITIVVEGNLYIGDDFEYNHPDSGVLFLVKGKTDDPNTPEREDESFYDANKNYVYDPGEPLINDDGDGVYEGPKEGQGNISFGDVAYGTGGVTDGFMYAENNAYLMDSSTATNPIANMQDKHKIYGVNGFLSAGGVVDLGNRRLGDDYFQYKVKYDDRLEKKEITFKGLPNALGGGSDFALLAWTTRRL